MRFLPEPYRLSFLLPDGAKGLAGDYPVIPPPAESGCEITMHRCGLVAIIGPSREAVFGCAAAVLRIVCGSVEPVSIASVLITPERGLCGRDSWSIIVGADVAFSPTALPPFVPANAARDPPRLATIDGECVH